MHMQSEGGGGHVNAGFDADPVPEKSKNPDIEASEKKPTQNGKPSKADQLWEVRCLFVY